jgi:hypothetical protein
MGVRSGGASALELVSIAAFGEASPADEAAAEGEEALVDLGAAVIADEQTAELVQPGEGAFHDPAVTAEAGAVLGLATRDERLDPSPPKLSAVAVGVVAAVADKLVGSAAGPADDPAHGRYPIEEREQLGDVVAVAAGEGAGERDSALVDDQVVFGAQPSTVNRARARLAAPLFACT